MTNPGGLVGVVEGELRITTDKVDEDVHEGLEEAGKVGDRDMKKLGKDLGETFDEELKKSTKDTGRDVARAVSAGISREGFRVTKVTTQLDADHNFVRHWVTEELVKGERAIRDIDAAGGFKKIGNVFSDAIGASFNISGKSPLIALLVPLIGFIGELVVGAIQIVNGLVAVIAILPNAIGAVILQAGVLFLAFKGVGTAIQEAFAAKNPEELRKALENLTPAAQEFVKALLPLREVFKEFSAIAQENFFDRMGVSVQRLMDSLGPILRAGIGPLASGLGDVFRGILNVLSQPVFARFLTELIPATVDWLRSFNSAFQDFLGGLAAFGSAVMPFFSWLGDSLNQALAEFGVWLRNLSTDPEFIQWLEDMKTNLVDGAEALGAIIGFLKEFVNSLNEAGGNEALKDITAQFNELAKFLATEEGIKAMEGLLHTIQILAYIFIFMINDVILFLFLFEVTAEFLKVLFTSWLPDWLAWAGEHFVQWVTLIYSTIADFFTNKIPEFFTWVGGYITNFFNGVFEVVGGLVIGLIALLGSLLGWIISQIFNVTGAIATWISDRLADIGNFFGSLGSRIASLVGDMLGTLYQAGRNLITGLINGVKSMFGALGNAASEAAQVVRNRLPFSPAKEGPLAGSGDPLIAGQKIIERIAAGMEMEAPVLANVANNAASSVLVGANAVQMNFYGQTPTNQQAAGIGAAAGNSLANTLAARDTRLAIRSIGTAAVTA